MNPFTVAWLGWGALFAVLETWALLVRRHTPGGTLSELVWRFISWRGGLGHRVARVLFVVVWADLTTHFLWGWPFWP